MGHGQTEATQDEARGAIRWLIAAGGAALLLSAGLFWADEFVMGGARARDIEHNKMLEQVRSAQISLPSNASDHRQLLELAEQHEQKEQDAAAAHAEHHAH